jgi:hypothetical protein
MTKKLRLEHEHTKARHPEMHCSNLHSNFDYNDPCCQVDYGNILHASITWAQIIVVTMIVAGLPAEGVFQGSLGFPVRSESKGISQGDKNARY